MKNPARTVTNNIIIGGLRTKRIEQSEADREYGARQLQREGAVRS